jgi:hypothetical protein
MLIKLIKQFNNEARVYYFDIPFGETVNRHNTKENAAEFNEKDMKKWWVEKDYLHVEQEQVITSNMSKEDIIATILRNL